MPELDYQRIIEDNFFIVDKSEKAVPFRFNSVQKKLYDTLTGRDIVLKARQEGISSLTLALFTCDFLFSDNSRSVCIAHDKDSVIKLFDRVKYFIKSFEEVTKVKVPLQYNTRTELVNELNNASFYIGSAGAGNFGRSATLTNVHFSEMAFYNEPEKVYLAASQAGTPRRIIIESTAWGYGDFYHKMWDDAMNGRNNYVAHFFGWQDFDEYTAPKNVAITLTTAEEQLKERFKLTNGQLAWRRVKLSEFTTDESFKREYPMIPEEAFIHSGNPVFSTDSLQWYRTAQSQMCPPVATGQLIGANPVVLDKSEHGYLKVWKMPVEMGQYVIGADTAEGVADGDYSCAVVIDKRSFEVVAVWHGHVDIDVFGREMYRLGMFYNEAMIGIERNGGGIASILSLRNLYYPNVYIRESVGKVDEKLMPEMGWVTNAQTKQLMIAEAARVIRDKVIILHDEQTINELFSYQYDDAGHANAITGAHDDRVMALMISIQMYNRTPLNIQTKNAIVEPVSTNPFEPVVNSTNDFDFSGGEPSL